MDLVKTILNQLSGDTLGKLGSLAGADAEATKKATGAAVPAILASLAGMASSDDGARKLANTMNGLDLGSLGNLAKALGGGSGGAASTGGDLLSSLVGESLLGNIAGAVGKYAGVDAAVIKKLLAPLMPFILSVVAGQWKSQGGSVGALSSLFADQKRNIAAAVPAGFNLASIPGLPGADAMLRVAGDAASKSAAAAENATRSVLTWAAPLAGVALVALGLWYFLGRGAQAPQVAQNAANQAAKAAQGAANKTVDAVQSAASTAANSATAAVKALKPELPAVPGLPDIAKLTTDMSGIFGSATQALGTMRDATSAQAALPKLAEVNTQIDGIRDLLDRLPEAAQTALGKIVGQQFAPLQEQAAKIAATPQVSDQVKFSLDQITSKLAGLNLAQVSKDASGIFAMLTQAVGGLKDSASAEAAMPRLEEVSLKLDDLKRVQASMSPGGQSMLAKLVATARASLDPLITKALDSLGVSATLVKPKLDQILDRLTGLANPPTPAQPKT